MLDKSITKAVQVISLFRLQTTELIKMFLVEASKQSMQAKQCNTLTQSLHSSCDYTNGDTWDTQYGNTVETLKSKQK